MKSLFFACVAFCVLSMATKNASCKSLGSIERNPIISRKDSDNTGEVTYNKLNTLVNIDKRFRIRREIVSNVGCPLNMRRIITCVPIRKFRLEKRKNRKHGLRKNRKHINNL